MKRKKQIEADGRVKARHFTWAESALTYLILLTVCRAVDDLQ